MAFHVACPITCRRICFCTLGFPRSLRNAKAKDEFLDEIVKVEEFLKDPYGIRAREKDRTVQVVVPKVIPPPPPQLQTPVDGIAGGDAGLDEALSAQTKRAALQKKAAAVKVAVEDYARRFESGDLTDSSRNVTGDQQGQSNVNFMCRMCFFGENEGSERAKKMLSCKSCGKKYHRKCVKNWAQHRDLFHWSSWTCPSCRICEICRRMGDPNKFMFCKRCDGAYHCYCQQPPHKNVSSGPYLCPKHTRCHSCGSNVPGNGLSVRWFLGYTCCDACGRLFVKGNYCPVCLKVYRDSESTPMVCCDICQRWVHCNCDGISDEKYLQFQVDGNLQYKCPTCRGECYQVKDLEDAVQELWRRRDIGDRGLIASLRAAAGLPTQEDIFSISPYSDDEDNGPAIVKTEHGRSFKFSLKGLVDKSPKRSKDYGKKSANKHSKKKEYQALTTSKSELHQRFDGHSDAKSLNSFGYYKNDVQSCRNEGLDVYSSPATGSTRQNEEFCSRNQPGFLKQRFVDEVMVSDEDRKTRVIEIKSLKAHGVDSENDTGKDTNKSKGVKGKKLVINFGARKINVANSPRTDTSSGQREQEFVAINGNEDTGQRRMGNKFVLDQHDGIPKAVDVKGDDGVGNSCSKSLKVLGREGNFIKLGKVKRDVFDLSRNSDRGNVADRNDADHRNFLLGKRSAEEIKDAVGSVEASSLSGERASMTNESEGGSDVYNESNDNHSHSLPKDSRPLLRLKFKRPRMENQNTPRPEEEKSSIKGQRSKRRRPSPFVDKLSFNEGEDIKHTHEDSLMDEIMDANWVLKKLGKDAVGKRVEIHQPSNNSWHKGVVSEVVEGTSKLSITLDDGKVKTLELGKQGIRFVSQK